jgi:hypothetical protein
MAAGSYKGSITDRNGASCKFWETGPNGGLLPRNKPHGSSNRGIGFVCPEHNRQQPYSCWYRSTENPHTSWARYNKKQTEYYDGFAADAAANTTLCSSRQLSVTRPGDAAMDLEANEWSPI